MKILILQDDFPPDSLGGAGMIAFRLAKEFSRLGHEVFVITATSDKEKVGMSQYEGLTINKVYSNYHERWRGYLSLYNPQTVAEVKRIVSEFRPDVIHAHNVHTHLSYAALHVCMNLCPKVYLTAHDMMAVYPGPFAQFINKKDMICPKKFDYHVNALDTLKVYQLRYNFFRNIIIRNYLNHLSGVVAVSEALKDGLSQNGIRITSVIRNGIDAPAWEVPPEQNFKEGLGLSGADVVLFGGRLSGVKGGEVILEAMSRVAKHNPNARLLVVGRKDFYAGRMEKKAEALGIKEKIVFAGWLSEPDMKKAYAVSTIVVVPSVHLDPFPTVNLEAFAAGKPVVATCFGGSPEIVKDGENGFIVNPFNVVNLADAIVDLLSDKEKARKFGETGHRLVAEKYSIDEMAKKYLSLFSK